MLSHSLPNSVHLGVTVFSARIMIIKSFWIIFTHNAVSIFLYLNVNKAAEGELKQ